MALHNVCQLIATVEFNESNGDEYRKKLFEGIDIFLQCRNLSSFKEKLSSNCSPIQTISCSDNKKAIELSEILFQKGFDLRPIRFPSVPKGKERLRICLHACNLKSEIEMLFESLEKYYL